MSENCNIRKEKGNKEKEKKIKRGQWGGLYFQNYANMYKIVLGKTLLCIHKIIFTIMEFSFLSLAIQDKNPRPLWLSL